MLASVAWAEVEVDPAPSGNEQAEVYTQGDGITVTIPGADTPTTDSREGNVEKIDYGSTAPPAEPADTTVIYDDPK